MAVFFRGMRKEAKQLAATMTKVGKLMGVKVSHLHPLLAYSAGTVKTMDAETLGRISFSRRRPPEAR